ncbi:MAG: hypothetical protein KQJ78_11160 [Deltaproteobacteria bacterium]|nr:hypothetical protein [Deltaproteobacteria bacterium]
MSPEDLRRWGNNNIGVFAHLYGDDLLRVADLWEAAEHLSELDQALCANYQGIAGLWMLDQEDMDARQVRETQNRDRAMADLHAMRADAWAALDLALARLRGLRE